MKKKGNVAKYVCVLAAAVLVTGLLAACGSSSIYSEATTEMSAADSKYDTGAIYENQVAGEGAMAEDAMAEEEVNVEVDESASSSRKLIKTVNMDVETDDYPALVSSVQTKTEELGGYMEQFQSYNENSVGNRSCNLTIRIPAENLDAFIDQVAEVSNIVSRQESVEDVTLQYVDMESHKKMLEEEQDRLLELLAQAETMEDIITLESRLTDVRYQLESMEAQLRTMDNQVSYSTVYLYIDEVERYTPPAEQGTWERIRTGFAENVYHVGNGLKEFFIKLVVSLPILVMLAIVIVIAVLLLKLVINLADKRNNARRKKNIPHGNPGVMPPQFGPQNGGPAGTGYGTRPDIPDGGQPASFQGENVQQENRAPETNSQNENKEKK